MEDFPKLILTVSVSTIILAVGTFAFFTVYNEIGYSESQTETFNVTNPNVANSHMLTYFPKYIVSVYQFNGIDWVLVDPIYYDCNQQLFTIQPGGMTGS